MTMLARPPTHWSRATLEELFDILDSRRVPINGEERATREGPIPYFGATGQVGWIDDFLFDEELVLLGEDGAPFLDPTKPKAYVIRGKSWVNNHAHVLRARLGPQAFWKHQLDCVDYHGAVSGTTRLKLPQGPMKTIRLLVPPEQEQARLLDAIDSYLSRLDAAAANLESAQKKLKAYRASVLKAAVEGRLVPTEATLARAEKRDFEPAEVLLKRIFAERRRRWEEAELAKMKAAGKSPRDDKWKAKYLEPEPPDTKGLPELPEGWCWATVEMLADVGTGATPNRSNPRYWINGTLPWVTSAVAAMDYVNEPSELVTDAALAETNLTLYPPGTLLVAMYGEGKTRGHCTELRIEAATNQALAALVTSGLAEPLRPWLRTFMDFNYENLRRLASGGVQPNLNLSIVRGIRVPLPPLTEQQRIVSEAEAALSTASTIGKEIQKQARRCTRLRQSILKWAFEGKLVDQDPSDEPAEKLLERIRAERAEADGPRRARRARNGQ